MMIGFLQFKLENVEGPSGSNCSTQLERPLFAVYVSK
jgi:hypothetical protein